LALAHEFGDGAYADAHTITYDSVGKTEPTKLLSLPDLLKSISFHGRLIAARPPTCCIIQSAGSEDEKTSMNECW
jgi:hypothetical protein